MLKNFEKNKCKVKDESYRRVTILRTEYQAESSGHCIDISNIINRGNYLYAKNKSEKILFVSSNVETQ